MSGGGLVEVIEAHDGEDLGRDHIEGLGWVYARRCDCGWHGRSELHATHLADVVTAHLAARLEGCREDVRSLLAGDGGQLVAAEAILLHVERRLGINPNVAPEPPASRSDGRTGRDGTSMQGERAEDGG